MLFGSILPNLKGHLSGLSCRNRGTFTALKGSQFHLYHPDDTDLQDFSPLIELSISLCYSYQGESSERTCRG